MYLRHVELIFLMLIPTKTDNTYYSYSIIQLLSRYLLQVSVAFEALTK